jgi:hypothetical protein
MAKSKKTLYFVCSCECDFFFDAKFKLLSFWYDADYRPEYMDPLFNKLGFTVEQVESRKFPEIFEIVKEHLANEGINETEIE